MSQNLPIAQSQQTVAPTPQNTPLTQSTLPAGLSRPTVPDIAEDAEPTEEVAQGDMEATLAGLVQGRLAGLVGKSSGYIETLPVEVKRSVQALKGVQVKQTELQNQYKRECLELEIKVRVRSLYDLFRRSLPNSLSDCLFIVIVFEAAGATI